MKSYGQFCSVARALDLLGERWSLLVVREGFASWSTRGWHDRRRPPRVVRAFPTWCERYLFAGVAPA